MVLALRAANSLLTAGLLVLGGVYSAAGLEVLLSAGDLETTGIGIGLFTIGSQAACEGVARL